MTTKTKIDELLELYDLPLEELMDKSAKITQENFKNDVEFCSIISAKTGKCGEDCKYCSNKGSNRLAQKEWKACPAIFPGCF